MSRTPGCQSFWPIGCERGGLCRAGRGVRWEGRGPGRQGTRKMLGERRDVSPPVAPRVAVPSPQTFRTDSSIRRAMNRRRLPHIGWWLLAIVPVVLLAVVAPFAGNYYRATRLEARVEAVGGEVEFESTAPYWIRSLAARLGIKSWLSFFETRPTAIDLCDATVDDEWLRSLSGHSDIRFLDLTRTEISDAGLLSLGPLPNLVHLYIAETRVRGTGLAILSQSPELGFLDCRKCQLESGALASLATLHDLEDLDLSDTPTTTSDLRYLNSRAKTFRLILQRTRVDDEIVDLLPRLPPLWEISLKFTNVTDATAVALSRIVSLNVVCLSGTKITDHGLRAIATLPALMELYVAATQITDDGTMDFERLKRLQYLDVSDTAVSDRSLERVLNLENLFTVSFSGTKVTDAGFSDLDRSSRRGCSIYLGDTTISNAALEYASTVNRFWTFRRERESDEFHGFGLNE